MLFFFISNEYIYIYNIYIYIYDDNIKNKYSINQSFVYFY